ncbi:hypothetical protein [Alkalibacterium gilvum]|uniref:hypothetical protein n=1 Tax=Alkalibacterium gilvum TaxID=1130080 RepID=UPI003F930165
MKIKSKEDVETIEEALNKMMISISFLKANSNYFTDDVLILPAAESELQLDYMIHQIQFLREELKEV